MKAQTLRTEEAPTKWWAAKDAHMRNTVNATLWSSAEKIQAERMKLGLETVYAGSNVYISYGKKGISIKIADAKVIDKKGLKFLEDEYETQGIQKKVTPQGTIYTISR